MIATDFTVFFPFCGLGAGALGFLDAQVELLGRVARFRSRGGIDNDALACADFRALTKSPCLEADVATLTVAELLAFCPESPDVVFASPPCTGFSALLSAARARTRKYRALNRLMLQWIELMLKAWAGNLPGLVLLENVPRIARRGRHLLRKVRKLLRAAGYVFHEQTHDAGELGGLAQHRQRFLLVARLPSRIGPLLYQPPKRRVRACGEVLGELPMPNDPAGGSMHIMPRISWLNWVRLALIPAGGDWRDLPGVLAELQARREVHKRHAVEDWDAPVGAVAGSGSNGVENVADPRVVPQADNPGAHWNKYAVADWSEPAATVTGASRPGSGAPAVADPRLGPSAHDKHYQVIGFDEPAPTIVGAKGSNAPSVADARAREYFANSLRVTPWGAPAGAVTTGHGPTDGGGSVADPRVSVAYDHGYRVLGWNEPSFTVHGKSHPGTGAYSVADVRVADLPVASAPRAGAYGVLAWDEAAKTVTGVAQVDNGAWAVSDPRRPDDPPVITIRDIRKPPSAVPVIIAKDGTWHRPLTTLELAALQGLPVLIDGKPLQLAGSSSTEWRRRIGNCVPPPAARAIAEQMLIALVEEAEGAMLLRGDGSVWVRPESAERAGLVGAEQVAERVGAVQLGLLAEQGLDHG